LSKSSRFDQHIINGILDLIEKEQRGVTEVEPKQNHYWSITDNVVYSTDEPSKQLAVGSLVDDYEFLICVQECEALSKFASIRRDCAQPPMDCVANFSGNQWSG
jgi:hypothetical protein